MVNKLLLPGMSEWQLDNEGGAGWGRNGWQVEDTPCGSDPLATFDSTCTGKVNGVFFKFREKLFNAIYK